MKENKMLFDGEPSIGVPSPANVHMTFEPINLEKIIGSVHLL